MAQLPELDSELREDFEAAAQRYADRANRKDMPRPPWAICERLDCEKGDVAIGILAVDFLSLPRSTRSADPWLIRARALGTPLEIVELSVQHLTAPATSVTGEVLRAVRPGELLEAAVRWARSRSSMQRAFKILGDQPSPEDIRWAQDAAGAVDRHHERYRLVAIEAVELYDAGERRVVQRLADIHGVSLTNMREQVRQARRLGYLAPGRRGRQSFRLGHRLRPEHDGNEYKLQGGELGLGRFEPIDVDDTTEDELRG